MASKEPAERIIEQMLGTSFPEASYSAIREASLAVCDVGLRRAPTLADAVAFERRFRHRLLPEESGPPDGTTAAAASEEEEESAARATPRRSLRWPPSRRREEQRVQAESREARRHSALLAAGQRNGELLARALEDPELADTIYTGEDDVPPGKKRQFLFVRAMYNSIVLAWMTGAMAWDELHGRMRVLMRQPVAREYWLATQPERASMPSGNDEARVASLVDLIVSDFEDDAEEWWAVGEPPRD
ncbi:DUF6082 family protein [Streptomyces sp. NPDC058272]|uniref:DUF6082 family protein n=1 Tax=Streptomyces sp. NPDC058272 TaxID=3346415 RepID=UPI0036E85DD1